MSENAPTSNLWAHLELWHPKVLDKLKNIGARDPATVAAEARAEAMERARGKQTEGNLMRWVQKSSKNKPAAELHVRLLLFIVRCGVAFEAIDSVEFKSLMKHRDTKVMSPDYMLQTVLPGVAAFVEKEIRKPLATVSSVCVVVDGWERNRNGVLGILGHWIDDDWKLRSDVLGLLRCPEYQSGINIAASVSARVQNALGKNTTVAACITDNDAKYKKASDLIANGELWPCACHTLQLCVRDAFTNTPAANSLLKKVHGIVVQVRNNADLRGKVRAAQLAGQFRELELIQDNATRWHSQLRMLERFEEVSEACREALGDEEELTLTAGELITLQGLVRILKRFKTSSDVLEKEKEVTISRVIPSIHRLRRVLATDANDDDDVAAFTRCLLNQVNTRFGLLFDGVTLPAMASALDPRTGDLRLLSPSLRDAVWERLAADADDILGAAARINRRISPSVESIRGLLKDVRSSFEDAAKRSTLGLDKVEDPLAWWSEQKDFRTLWPLVKMLLCIQASNASVERLFSECGFLSDGRHSLGLERLEMMVMIRHYILALDENDPKREELIQKIVSTVHFPELEG